MKTFTTLLIAFVLTLPFAAQAEKQDSAASASVLAVMFHADHCGSCKVMEHKLTEAKLNLAEAPVLFVKLDHTNRMTQHQAALLANRLGISKQYQSAGKGSGFMLLIDAQSGEVLDTIRGDQDVAAIETSIKKGIN